MMPPERLLSLLAPGEKLNWWEKPDTAALKRSRRAALLYVAAVGLFFTYLLAQISGRQLTVTSFAEAVSAGAARLFAAGGTIPLVAALVAGGLLYQLVQVFRKLRSVESTLYAITDRRIILLDAQEELSFVTIPDARRVGGFAPGIAFTKPMRRQKGRIYGFVGITSVEAAIPLLQPFIDPKTSGPYLYEPHSGAAN